jgi:hypothetical protein
VGSEFLLATTDHRGVLNIGRVFPDARGKANSDALIILMTIAVNEMMDIPEGKRKDATAAKLRDAYGKLDVIGDGVVQKIRTAISQKKE